MNEPSDALVFFGATGDLAYKKIFPSLQSMIRHGHLNMPVIGVAKAGWNLEQFKARAQASLQEHGGGINGPAFEKLCSLLRYVDGDYLDPTTFTQLRQALNGAAHPLHYLAIPPSLFGQVAQGLAQSQCNQGARIIAEKPFGRDLKSARELNKTLVRYFPEDAVFRIDHYLGKETVQNILVFRFGNGIFEPIWNRNFIDHVEITAVESIGIEGRGPFYEKAGALRDVLQNHVMEVLSFVAMEPPDSFDASSVRAEKLKVWTAIDPIEVEDTVRGQYGPGRVDGEKVIGYREEDRVDPESNTETFVAMKLQIENWRWAGVPIYVRAGKRLAKRVTEVTVVFKQPPLHMFKSSDARTQVQPNVLKILIQPDEGISLMFGAKVPGPTTNVMPVEMHFSYAESFGMSNANGYERLLLDAMLGDGTLFAHRSGVEATWALMTPILEEWAKRPPHDFPNYEAGSWGPAASDALLLKDRRKWFKL